MSRLVCGANPFSAGSHLSLFVNEEMRRYCTPDQILKTLRRCQEVGINFWQAIADHYELYRRFVDEGGTMKHLSLGWDSPSEPPRFSAVSSSRNRVAGRLRRMDPLPGFPTKPKGTSPKDDGALPSLAKVHSGGDADAG